MKGAEITDIVIDSLRQKKHDFIRLNYPNADMIGHTGNFQAARMSVEAVDLCLARLIPEVKAAGGILVVTADHGNAEFSINADGSPNTAHTVNLVPVFLIDDDYTQISDGKLADLAPSILTIMGLEIPEEMTGNVIIDKL